MLSIISHPKQLCVPCVLGWTKTWCWKFLILACQETCKPKNITRWKTPQWSYLWGGWVLSPSQTGLLQPKVMWWGRNIFLKFHKSTRMLLCFTGNLTVGNISGFLSMKPFDKRTSLNDCSLLFIWLQWSFGVLLWEIYTFGEFPYKGISDLALVSYLKAGTRLSEPPMLTEAEMWVVPLCFVCFLLLQNIWSVFVRTVSVCFSYELMLVCWEWDPAARPTFTELRVKLNDIFGESCFGFNWFLWKFALTQTNSIACVLCCRNKGQLHQGWKWQQ